jgi:hypothetical protein
MKTTISALFLAFVLSASGQSKITETTIEVDGLCGMCEERIENAAYIKGVKKADWSQETHQLDLIFRSDKTTLTEIIAAINEVGHDVKDHLATDEQYANIHGCCRFRDPEQRKAHGLGDPLCKPGETHEEHHAHGGKDKH